MRFPIPITIGQFCKMMNGIKKISIFNFDRCRYDYSGDPGEIPEELKFKKVMQYYYRPDTGLAIIHI